MARPQVLRSQRSVTAGSRHVVLLALMFALSVQLSPGHGSLGPINMEVCDCFSALFPSSSTAIFEYPSSFKEHARLTTLDILDQTHQNHGRFPLGGEGGRRIDSLCQTLVRRQ